MSNKLDFVKYSFDDLVTQINDKISEMEGWQDTYLFGNGQILVDLLAYLGNLFMYAVERRAEESTLSTARLRSSVVRLVTLLGYKVKRPISSTGSVVVSLPGGAVGEDIYIPFGTEFESLTGYKFSASEDTYLLAGSTSVEVPVIQGVDKSLVVSGTGLISQKINIPSEVVENGSILVTVNNVEWEQVDSFFNCVGSDLVYRDVLASDNTVDLYFGNNLQGAIPEINSVIDVVYFESDGSNGNIYVSDSITVIVDKIYNIYGVEVTDLTVTNVSPVIGGSDEESLEHIRYYAPKIFATGQRAVSKTDFEALVGDYPGVATVKVWGERDNGLSPDYDQYNKVNICMVMQGWLTASTQVENLIGDYLRDFSMLTVKYEFVDPTILDVVIGLRVICSAGSNLFQVRSKIKNDLETLFVLGETSKLGTKKPISDIISAVSAVDGVVSSSVVMKIQDVMEWNSGASQWELEVPQLPIDPGSVEILVGGVVMAGDNRYNDIRHISGSSVIISGGVDYDTTGLITVQFPEPQPLAVVVRYQQPNMSIVPDYKNICKLDSVEFDSIGY